MKTSKTKATRTVTYAIDGLVECTLTIRVGCLMHPIHFSGGRQSGFGTTPATFTTSDPLLQHYLERSRPFIDGRIRLL